jgi:hypothetical protein
VKKYSQPWQITAVATGYRTYARYLEDRARTRWTPLWRSSLTVQLSWPVFLGIADHAYSEHFHVLYIVTYWCLCQRWAQESAPKLRP